MPLFETKLLHHEGSVLPRIEAIESGVLERFHRLNGLIICMSVMKLVGKKVYRLVRCRRTDLSPQFQENCRSDGQVFQNVLQIEHFALRIKFSTESLMSFAIVWTLHCELLAVDSF